MVRRWAYQAGASMFLRDGSHNTGFRPYSVVLSRNAIDPRRHRARLPAAAGRRDDHPEPETTTRRPYKADASLISCCRY